MVRINISLPEDLTEKLQALATESGYLTVESYIEALLRVEAQTEEFGAPSHLSARDRDQLDTLVREGLATPAREMISADWDQMRQQLLDSHQR